jgi:hypothetical protein
MKLHWGVVTLLGDRGSQGDPRLVLRAIQVCRSCPFEARGGGGVAVKGLNGGRAGVAGRQRAPG